jgi:hypothetical protein
MKRRWLLALFAATAAVICLGVTSKKCAPLAAKEDHVKWIADSLKEMQTVKVGMTRNQLLRVFTMEGGLSIRPTRTYVYHECPYIKVDVQFRPVGNEDNLLEERGEDVIAGISRPYLGWSICD